MELYENALSIKRIKTGWVFDISPYNEIKDVIEELRVLAFS